MDSIALLFFLVISSSLAAYSQKTVKGYIVTKDNDTLKVQIRLADGLSNQKAEVTLAQSVEIIEADTSRVLQPSDINGYGFIYRGKHYERVSKPINKYRNAFLVPEFVGEKASLYSITITKNYDVPYGLNPVGGVIPVIRSEKATYYTFEKSDGKKLFVYRDANAKALREIVKDFFSDRPDLHTEIDKKVVSSKHRSDVWKSIEGIFAKYNQL
jgi:hypothetical protein